LPAPRRSVDEHWCAAYRELLPEEKAMNLRPFVALSKLVLTAVFLQASLASGADLKLLSATGMRSALEELAPRFERTMGHKLTIDYDASGALKRTIDAGAAFDVAILTPGSMDEVVKSGKVAAATRTLIGRSGVGLASRAGAPKPAIDSADSLKRALLGAKSVAYAPDGVTAAHLLRLIERFGIADEMKPKLKPYKNAEHALRAVADGEADFSFSGTSVILAGRGVQLAGALPAEFQDYVVYSAALGTAASNADGGKALIRFLTDERAAAVLKDKGFEPAAPR
jgi:molybdate transport system substrate-binding protein